MVTVVDLEDLPVGEMGDGLFNGVCGTGGGLVTLDSTREVSHVSERRTARLSEIVEGAGNFLLRRIHF